MVFKPSAEDAVVFGRTDGSSCRPISGPSGWLVLDFEAAAVDWEEVAELAEESYRQVALKRMVAALKPDIGRAILPGNLVRVAEWQTR